MNENERPDDDAADLDRIPIACACGASWEWNIQQPDTMRCPVCDPIVEAAPFNALPVPLPPRLSDSAKFRP